MTDLSPAAHVVWRAYETANCDPYLIDPRRAGVAAALRAAANQVVPETPLISDPDEWERGEWETNQQTRISLLAIANELEQS
jgi:hypothetical protein